MYIFPSFSLRLDAEDGFLLFKYSINLSPEPQNSVSFQHVSQILDLT